MTEHWHRTQLPRWGVVVIVTVFLLLLFLGISAGGWQGTVLGLVLAFGFLSVAGYLWGYDSTDGRNWR